MRVMSSPCVIDLEYNENKVVRTVIDPFDNRVVNVYVIETVIFQNPTGQTYRFRAKDEQGHDWTTLVTPGEEGERNIPTPMRYESFPLQFGVSLVR